MPTLSEVFNSLATRAGIEATNPELVAILANPELSKINIPDALKGSLEKGLHTLESAESVIKPKLEKQFKAEVYNGVDAEAYLIGREMGLDDAEIEALKAADKTTTRIKTLAQKIKEKQTAAAGATGADKAKLVEEINTLRLEAGKLTASHQAALAAKDSEVADKINKFAIDNHFNGYDYEDSKPKNVNVITGKTLVEQEIAKLEAVPFYNEKTGQIELRKKDGTDVFDATNNKITYKSMTDKVLAEAKLLKISGQNGNGNNGGNNGGNPPPTPPAGIPGAASFDALIGQSISDVSR